MLKNSKNFQLNHVNIAFFVITIVIYGLLSLSVNLNVAAGAPVYYRALEGNFSPFYFAYNFVPLLLLALGYQIATPYWFSSFREWSLLRSKSKIIFKQIKSGLLLSVAFVFVSWLTTMLILLIFTSNIRVLPAKTGLIGLLGPITGMILLLIVTIVVDFGIILLPLIGNLFLKRKWQVLVFAILVNFFLPILLFTLHLLPENDMPINLLYGFVNAAKLTDLVIPIIYVIGTVAVEILILVLIDQFHERTSY